MTPVDTQAPATNEIGIDNDAGMAEAIATLTGPAAPAAPTAPATTSPSVPVETETKPAAGDTAALLARFAKLENERDEAITARDAAAEAAARVKDLEAELAKWRTAKDSGNPVALLQELGLTPEAIQDYVLNGPKKTDPAVSEVQKQLAEVKARQAELDARDAAAAQAGKIAAYKASIKLDAAKYPLLHAAYGDVPTGVADQVFELQAGVYRNSNGTKEPTPDEAAAVIEAQLAKLHGAFAKVAPGTGAAAKPPAPPTVGLSNTTPTTSPTGGAPDYDDDEAAMAAAIALLKRK